VLLVDFLSIWSNERSGCPMAGRFFVRMACWGALSWAATRLPAATAQAHDFERVAAERLQTYQYVEFPQYVRELDRQLEQARAEVRFWSDRVANYRPLTRFGKYSAAYGAEQRDELWLLEARQHLARLQEQRQLLWRHHQAHVAALLREAAAARR
jgi:hypothetical protein